MPCRCDYEPAPVGRTLKEEHTRACQAQSLVHKLALILEAKVPESIPKDIAKRIGEMRQDLLTHKRLEHKEDIDKAAAQIDKLERNVKAINGLGGVPKKSLLDDIENLKKKRVELLNVSDSDLLGDDHY